MDSEKEHDLKKAEIHLKLADRARDRFESLRVIEWKLNIGLWTLLAFGSAGVVATDNLNRECMTLCFAGSIALVIVVLYGWWWLPYINDMTNRDTGCGYFHETQVRRLLDGESTTAKLPDSLRPGEHDKWLGESGGETRYQWLCRRLKETPPLLIPMLTGHWLRSHTLYFAVTVVLALTFFGAFTIKPPKGVNTLPDAAVEAKAAGRNKGIKGSGVFSDEKTTQGQKKTPDPFKSAIRSSLVRSNRTFYNRGRMSHKYWNVASPLTRGPWRRANIRNGKGISKGCI